MIDNPLPDQVMQELDLISKNTHFEDCCKIHAVEIAKHYKVHDDLHEDFAEWYYDYMSQNPELFEPTFILLDSDYIVDWWKDNEEYFDDFETPYEPIEPTDQEMMASFGTKWHDGL